ncbi:putative pheromone shutdown, TraB [Medicago truncatula]|uniref:Putative pheromone shutdown, TraB n=1 Tax=Medicago truncatula TaxID=3880 RepID=G7IAR4_MEDTR|nr:traB domain-containing protein isoform X2 [Medicago truncatula]AES62567.1 TraB family protein [Medicago truncatula]RHN81875.1 putative pheromone shutdown, TraB [Medicago truncatula]
MYSPIIKPTFPIFTTNPFFISKTSLRPLKVSVKPPPPDFNYKLEISDESRAVIEECYPELLDLADNGSLVLVQKKRFGPVPSWRTEFVEPEYIWLIGTTHVSKESAMDVERVVKAVKPDNVVVELCRSRAGIMYADDDQLDKQLRSTMFSLSGTGFFGAIGRSINLGGQTALALRLLLAAFSSKISSNIDRPFGDEFRAARKVSEEVGAQLVLGDRPIEITLQRAWKALNWTQKLSLLTIVVRGITSSSDISTDKLEKASSNDGTLQLYEQLSFSYPSLLPPLIHERDTYLAWSLKRSKAVNNCKRVVGVIGKGHMNGVIYALLADTGNLRFRDLTGKNSNDGGSNGWIDDLVKSLVRDTVIGIVLWALYEYINGGTFSF